MNQFKQQTLKLVFPASRLNMCHLGVGAKTGLPWIRIMCTSRVTFLLQMAVILWTQTFFILLNLLFYHKAGFIFKSHRHVLHDLVLYLHVIYHRVLKSKNFPSSKLGPWLLNGLGNSTTGSLACQHHTHHDIGKNVQSGIKNQVQQLMDLCIYVVHSAN